MRPVAAAVALVAALAVSGAARAGGDGGVAVAELVHVQVGQVTVTGNASAEKDLDVGAVATAVCNGIGKTPKVSCLTTADSGNLGRLRRLQSLFGTCSNGNCGTTDQALLTPDYVVAASIQATGSGFVLHLTLLRPSRTTPVARFTTKVTSAKALLAAARTGGRRLGKACADPR